MERTNEVKRSELWDKIYSIVSQIPRAKVDGDAVDYSSASTEIEKFTLLKDAPTVATDNTLPTKKCSTHCDWPNCTLEGCRQEQIDRENHVREQEREKAIDDVIMCIEELCPSPIYEMFRKEMYHHIEKLKESSKR